MESSAVPDSETVFSAVELTVPVRVKETESSAVHEIEADRSIVPDLVQVVKLKVIVGLWQVDPAELE